MSDKTDLLAIGHTAFDYIIQVGEFPQPNSSTAIKRMRTFFGGAAANVAVVASTLGLKSSLVSAVGGEFIGSIRNGTLIDGTGKPSIKHAAVLIRNNQIIFAGPENSIKLPETTKMKMIDANDGFILPGFVDAHVHIMAN
ncbi:MAG: PfkB family carbohydrate kinase, partial [Methanobacterium paludis]|nr:PfkB family carbohydrate kinase [Methanobacterium paludis]